MQSATVKSIPTLQGLVRSDSVSSIDSEDDGYDLQYTPIEHFKTVANLVRCMRAISSLTDHVDLAKVAKAKALGGHVEDISISDQYVEKKTQSNEIKFYEAYSSFFSDIVPEYMGQTAENSDENSIVLKRIDAGMNKAVRRAADVKIGSMSAHRYDLIVQQGMAPKQADSKVTRMQASDKKYGNDIRGYRVVGCSGLEKPEGVNLKEHRRQIANKPISATLGYLFNNNPKAIGSAVERIKQISTEIEQNEHLVNFGFIGSSLFIAYDPTLSDDAVEIKLIDFLHSIRYQEGEPAEKRDAMQQARTSFLNGLNQLAVDLEQYAEQTVLQT